MELEKKPVNTFFTERLKDHVVIDEKLALLLLLLGERPGVLIMNPDLKDRKVLKQFTQEFNLEHLYTGGEGERGLRDRLLREDSRMFKGGFFIAEDEGRFRILERSEGRFYGFSDRAVGQFLGYPEDDTEYFSEHITDGHIERPTGEKAVELVSEGVLKKNDVKYLELVSYVPRPREENMMKAVETGKEREQRILDMDERLDIDTGKQILREVFRDPLYRT